MIPQRQNRMIQMEIISIQPIDKKKCKVRLDTGVDFVLYKGEIRAYELAEGEELSAEKYERLLTEVFYPRAKSRALHLLEKMDRSEAGLRRKLSDNGYPAEAIDVAIAYVEQYHYIDDERLARSYVRFYQESRSRRRIQQDLEQKGIAKDVIARCIEEEYQVSEIDLIKSLLAKKHYDPATATCEERAKMYRFLMSRGYRSSDITHTLDVGDDY